MARKSASRDSVARVVVRADAGNAQELIHAQGDYGHVTVRAHGFHLLIQVSQDGRSETVARLTDAGSDGYEASFRNSAGRWEPLPIRGHLKEAVLQALEMLGPFLRRPENPLTISGTDH